MCNPSPSNSVRAAARPICSPFVSFSLFPLVPPWGGASFEEYVPLHDRHQRSYPPSLFPQRGKPTAVTWPPNTRRAFAGVQEGRSPTDRCRHAPHPGMNTPCPACASWGRQTAPTRAAHSSVVPRCSTDRRATADELPQAARGICEGGVVGGRLLDVCREGHELNYQRWLEHVHLGVGDVLIVRRSVVG